VSSSIRGKRSWHDDRRRGRCAAYRLDQAPEVPLQCLRLPQLGVVSPRVNHNSCNALVIGIEVVGVLAARCILTPDLWASARDVSSVAFRFLSWACFPSSSWIRLSTASSSSCTECSSNVSSPAHKGRHKSAIKASSSETMLNVCMRVWKRGIGCVRGTRADFANGL